MIHESKKIGIFRSSRRVSPPRSNFASLSSSISSIAVSGFQGSPRSGRAVARGVNIRPIRAPGDQNRPLHETSTRGPGRPARRERPPSRVAREGGLGAETPVVGQRRPALPRADPAVPSALGGLTSGFGMGPGVPPLPWSLTNEGHSAVRGQALRRALRAAQRGFATTSLPRGIAVPKGNRKKSSAY